MSNSLTDLHKNTKIFSILDLHEIQRNNLIENLNKEKFTNVMFIVGKNQTKFKVNRFMMASISPAFEAMLYGNMQESEPNSEVLIDDADDKSFECIIKHSYCNDPGITHETVCGVKYLCTKYQIDTLSKFVEETFKASLTAHNHFCQLLNGAINIKCDEFAAMCKKYLQDLDHSKRKHSWSYTERATFATNIINSDGFLQFNLKGMMTLLAWNCLAVEEEVLWDRLVKWAEHQSKIITSENIENINVDNDENEEKKVELNPGPDIKASEYRSYLLKSIKKCVRFGLMSGPYFADVVKPENIFTNNELISIFWYLCSNNKSEVGCSDFCIANRI